MYGRGGTGSFRTLSIACLTRSDLISPLLARFATNVALVDPELLQAMMVSYFALVAIQARTQRRLDRQRKLFKFVNDQLEAASQDV